ncbi:MAG TPA: ATP-binding protein [Candidatus Avalokitesvara rifleensis]|uniref:ATP-binding protein n=1 Tax=Candidatus Avalokitesvara rifleensis TaxID=3367620 RepID=UPI00271407B7|nr:ATP-binding protein [Candidatus Brocadiales bacterium]
MQLYEIVSLTGFLAGSVLHVVLLALIYQRKNKTPSELAFFFLVVTVAMWNVGNTISIFSLMLFGRSVSPINYVADAVAYIGVGLIPSLLLHTATLYLTERGLHMSKRLQGFITVVVYLPVLPFSVAVREMVFSKEAYLFTAITPFVKPFVVWLMIALGVTALISYKVSRLADDPEDQRFHVYISWVLVSIATFIGFIVLLEGRHLSYVGDYFVLAAMLSSIFPSIIFSYFVYRFNYMEFVLRRSVFYSFLTLILICLYYFGIKQFSKYMERHYDVNPKVLEATLVIALVYWFPKVKEKLQDLMRTLLFRRVADSEYLLTDLSHTIAEDSLVNLPKLLNYVTKAIKNATGAKKTKLILFKGSNVQVFGDDNNRALLPRDVSNIAKYFVTGELTVLERPETKDVNIVGEMKSLDVQYVFPIFEERNLVGLLCLDKSIRGFPLPADNLEQLLIIASQISSALDKAKVIDEKLQLERRIMESEKLLSLGRLSASVAHEVKNPLSSIKSIVQVLKEDVKWNEKSGEALSIIVGEIDRLAKVVNQLLQFAKPAGGRRQNHRLSDVLSGVLLVLRHEAGKNGVTIHQDIPEDIPLINAEEGALQEVFFNLIHNGIQVMPKGGTLSITTDVDKGNRLKIRVTDTGPGISAESVDKIFEPFYTTKQTGTGLGLSIVKKRLEEMGGSVEVESGPAGTSFVIKLPIQEGSLSEAAEWARG